MDADFWKDVAKPGLVSASVAALVSALLEWRRGRSEQNRSRRLLYLMLFRQERLASAYLSYFQDEATEGHATPPSQPFEHTELVKFLTSQPMTLTDAQLSSLFGISERMRWIDNTVRNPSPHQPLTEEEKERGYFLYNPWQDCDKLTQELNAIMDRLGRPRELLGAQAKSFMKRQRRKLPRWVPGSRRPGPARFASSAPDRVSL